MMHNDLLVFFIFLTKTHEVDNIDNGSSKLIVSQYDWTKVQDIRMYSLNKVIECKISPETLFTAPATITLIRKNFGTDLQQCFFVKVHFSNTNVK